MPTNGELRVTSALIRAMDEWPSGSLDHIIGLAEEELGIEINRVWARTILMLERDRRQAEHYEDLKKQTMD